MCMLPVIHMPPGSGPDSFCPLSTHANPEIPRGQRELSYVTH